MHVIICSEYSHKEVKGKSKYSISIINHKKVISVLRS